MLTRLRTTKASGLKLEVRATCTANGVGFNWVKKRWSVPDDGGPSLCQDPVTGFHRRFIPARLSDNPHVRAEEYVQQLQALPVASRAALLGGRWAIHECSCFPESSSRI